MYLQAKPDESFTGVRFRRLCVDTRHGRRVSTEIRRLAEDFAIAFARNPQRETGGILARITFDSSCYDDRMPVEGVRGYARASALLTSWADRELVKLAAQLDPRLGESRSTHPANRPGYS